MRRSVPPAPPASRFSTIAVWTMVLGATGFACGFFGPMALAPDANQGPLLGIFVTGPGGAALGFVLGLAAAFLPIGPRTRRAALVAIALVVAGVTLYFSTPEPVYLAGIVEAKVVGCSKPSTRAAKAFEHWDQEVTRRASWATPKAGWKDRASRMLKDDEGVVLEMRVLRRSQVRELRKPWNRGTRIASPWKKIDRSSPFYAPASGGSCESYELGREAIYLTTGAVASEWPPDSVPNFLSLQVVQPIPPEYEALISR